VQGLIDNMLALGRRRLMILGGVVAGVLLMLLLGLSAVSGSDQALLYKDLSMASANSIESSLIGAGFDARISEDGTSVTVPRTDLARARMVLAEIGMPVEGEPGWELFDGRSGLAMNSFMQRVSRLRAMEGELARSIQTMEGIQSARVHLVLPEREAFSRERPDPRASIILRAAPGTTIERRQAIAIRNLVASAVPNLNLSNVTVLSTSGETILSEGGNSVGQVTMQSTKAAIEDRFAQQVKDILTARVGAGNARVRVSVELSTAREVVVEQSFDPDQQVVRSTDNRNEARNGTDARGNVGIENNIPTALAGPGSGATTNQSKTLESVEYEIGNTRREIVREAGEVRRVSVAVLVNGIYSVNDSDVTYTERTPEELKRLSALVQTAVGFNAARGDQVSVDSLRFMDYSMEVGEPVSLSMMQQISRNIVPILRGLLAVAVVGLVMVLAVRPTLRHLSEAQTRELEAAAAIRLAAPAADGESPGSEGAVTIMSDGAPNLAEPHVPGVTSIYEPEKDTGKHEYIETMGVRGNLIKARVEAIQTLADDKPDQVLRVLRSWLMAEADA
jgi:flagellar M-ring protein FliF